jgi:putative transposase
MEIRQAKYLNNIVEQDRRFIKNLTYPTLGFKNFHSAVATITGIKNTRMIKKDYIFGFDSTRFVFYNFCTLMA